MVREWGDMGFVQHAETVALRPFKAFNLTFNTHLATFSLNPRLVSMDPRHNVVNTRRVGSLFGTLSTVEHTIFIELGVSRNAAAHFLSMRLFGPLEFHLPILPILWLSLPVPLLHLMAPAADIFDGLSLSRARYVYTWYTVDRALKRWRLDKGSAIRHLPTHPPHNLSSSLQSPNLLFPLPKSERFLSRPIPTPPSQLVPPI
ncbi:hypothetical protein PM082_019642 [Marasmius tenuissimus]|nr:hypothetical protein PM082_019642 [Marasmius tenuissimus]